ncbi:MAG: diguanylate cyclase [Rubrivivax sp.]
MQHATLDREAPADACAAARLAQARALRKDDPQAALAAAQEALRATEGRRTALAAAALQLCGELQHDLADYEGAATHGARALSLHQVLADGAGTADSHDLLGRVHEKLGEDAEALVHHQQSLALGRAAQDGHRTCRALLCLGVLRYNQGDYPGAVGHYLEALALAQSAGDPCLHGRALGCLGNAFERMGELARSLEYHQQCLQRFDEAGFPRERSFALNNVANVYLALGDARHAITFHEASLALKRRLKDRWGEGTSLQNLGDCHLVLGELDAAQALFEQSLTVVEPIGDRQGMCVARLGLGEVAERRGDLETAAQSLQAAQRISAELGQPYDQVVSLHGLGRVWRRQGRMAQARAALEDALRLTQDIRTRRLAQGVLDELSSLCEETGDLPAALAHARTAYRLERELFNEDLENRLRHLKLHFELERADKEKALQLLRNAELARVNRELEHSNAQLEQANEQKARLLQALEKQKRQLQRRSTRDALTGLYNRRHFDQELSRAFRASRRYDQRLGVVICDIDDFKKINDRFSHQTGDEVLKAVARLLARHCRKTDVVARYGGEEFALLLTGTPGESAFAVCEKIRSLVARHPWQRIHPELKVTLSMGIADEEGAESHEALMAQADKRLYRAKHNGKNQVVLRP